MHMHARAIDLYTCDTDIMKPLYPLSRSVHCKKQKHNSYCTCTNINTISIPKQPNTVDIYIEHIYMYCNYLHV